MLSNDSETAGIVQVYSTCTQVVQKTQFLKSATEILDQQPTGSEEDRRCDPEGCLGIWQPNKISTVHLEDRDVSGSCL